MSGALLALALVAAACGSDDGASDDSGAAAETEAPEETEAPADSEPVSTEPAPTEAPVDTDAASGSAEPADTEPADTEPATTEPASTEPGDADDDDFSSAFPELAPPDGETIVVGLVNTEGTPGLDFPDIRLYVEAAVDYLNEHGGMGNRPIQLETCTANGSPETSQACAQELTGKGVELMMLGLDLFPDYATYGAAGTPVIGFLPILPGDYTADALFLTGGNATTMAAAAAVAKDHFGATKVGIVSADNPGANGTEASLTASLDLAGIEHTTVKGGDNETDAGYQGLMRQAADGDPDVLISLYSDAGCIGTMRGRASLGIEIPVITTGICSGAEVIDEVGDDAVGWTFIGVSTAEETPETAILQEVLAPAIGVEPAEVDPTALGLGGLGMFMVMSLAEYSNRMAAEGIDVTGASLYEYTGTTDGLTYWPGDTLIECGASAAYPSICSFTFPFAEYQEGGQVVTIPGLEAVSSLPYLP